MSLIKEKEVLYKLASEEKKEYFWKTEDENAESYFLIYDDCRHMDAVIDVFNSEDLVEIRERLQYLWGNDKAASKYTACILAALSKSQISTEGRFQNVELFNYMM